MASAQDNSFAAGDGAPGGGLAAQAVRCSHATAVSAPLLATVY
jgi:hypothetical protein